jgi:hypothetical protein
LMTETWVTWCGLRGAVDSCATQEQMTINPTRIPRSKGFRLIANVAAETPGFIRGEEPRSY